jgi:hypothetical protein
MKNKAYQKTVALTVFTTLLSLRLYSSQDAYDNAGTYSTWPQTASEGAGFGNWSFYNSTPDGGSAGELLASSTEDGQRYNINGPVTEAGFSGNAFGFYANQGAYADAEAVAPFLGGSLAPGQIFSIQIQSGNVAAGVMNGLSLQNSTGGNLFQFYSIGDQGDYFIDVGGQQIDTGSYYTIYGVILEYEQLAGDAWSVSIFTSGYNEIAFYSATLSSTSTGVFLANDNISQVDLQEDSGGISAPNNSSYDMFFNSLMIVPEPSTFMLTCLSGMCGWLLIHRWKCRKLPAIQLNYPMKQAILSHSKLLWA